MLALVSHFIALAGHVETHAGSMSLLRDTAGDPPLQWPLVGKCGGSAVQVGIDIGAGATGAQRALVHLDLTGVRAGLVGHADLGVATLLAADLTGLGARAGLAERRLAQRVVHADSAVVASCLMAPKGHSLMHGASGQCQQREADERTHVAALEALDSEALTSVDD